MRPGLRMLRVRPGRGAVPERVNPFIADFPFPKILQEDYMAQNRSVAIVEDDREYRELLVEMIARHQDYQVVLDVPSMEDYLWHGRGLQPDVVFMDIALPGMSGIRGIPFVKDKAPETDVIILTIFEDWEKVFRALEAGAVGYLLKSTPMDELHRYLDTLAAGGAPLNPEIALKLVQYFHPTKKAPKKSALSQREKEVVVAIFDGCSYKEISQRLHISVGTVYSHIKNIYRKLHVHSKVDLINKNLQGELVL